MAKNIVKLLKEAIECPFPQMGRRGERKRGKRREKGREGEKGGEREGGIPPGKGESNGVISAGSSKAVSREKANGKKN